MCLSQKSCTRSSGNEQCCVLRDVLVTACDRGLQHTSKRAGSFIHSLLNPMQKLWLAHNA